MRRWLAVLLPLFGLILSSSAVAAVAPEAGMLLVARPELPDPRFREAVILLVQHGPEGSVGLILNRPSRLPLAEALPQLPELTGETQTLAYGGPVSPRAFMVLVKVQGEPPDPAQKVLGSIYLTGPQQFATWFGKAKGGSAYRIFAGYGGWGPGQLATEMGRGDWQVRPAEEQVLFPVETAGLWQELVKQAAQPLQ